MGHITLSFSIQINPEGRVDVHSWKATYAPNGRQLPSHRTSAYDVDESYLTYLAGELVDEATLISRATRPSSGYVPEPLF